MAEAIVGRADELTRIVELLDDERPSLRALVLEGEPGIGKTMLWRAGVAYAQEKGLKVLTSSPSGGETQLSFSVLVDLLSDDVKPVLPKLPSPQRQALQKALLLEADAGTASNELTIAAATTSALAALAQLAPIVLAVDDSQWLDGASATALTYAIRRLGDSRVTLLVGRRTGEAPAAARPFLDALDALGCVALPVGPLGGSALEQLIHDRLGIPLPPQVVSASCKS